MAFGAASRSGRLDRDLRAIGALTQAVLDGDDLERLLGRIAAEARELVGAVSGVVVTVSGQPGVMTFRGVDGLSVGPLRVGHVMPVRGTLTELALIRGSNIVARDASEIPPAGRAFAAAAGTGPMIVAPLAGFGSARGAIVVARAAAATPFAAEDVALVSTFAAQAATAIELFDLRSAETALAAAAERHRIAGELHDGIVAALREVEAGVGALAVRAESRVTERIGAVQEQLKGAIEAINEYVVELRTTEEVREPVRTGSLPALARAPEPELRGTESPGSDDRTIAVIGELARATTADAAADGVLQALVDDVAARVGGSFALVGVLTEQGDRVRVRCRFGPELPGRGVGDLLPIGETLVGRAIDERRPVVTAPEGRPEAIPARVAAMVGPMVVVPLVVRGRQFGAMAIARSAGAAEFQTTDVGLIEAYGVQAAIVLEFDRVRHEVRAGSVSEERDRIGRDLHDRVIQLLFGVGFGLQSLESTVRDPGVRARLQATVEALDRTIRDLRRFVFGQGPAPVEPPSDRLEALAADNARLQREVEVQLNEVRASRRRIIAAGDAERKRVERDLHDGAQQRLVSLTLALRLARTKLGDDLDPAARSSLDQASADAKAALSELRELARGIHPQILTEAGLGAAAESLAARAPVPVVVAITTDRFPSGVEGAAYFTIAEGLTNIAKYATATSATIRADVLDGHLVIEIEDDGLGGADPAGGTGLRGLADRLEAINGTLDVHSPPGGGTTLVARIPVAGGAVPG